MAIDWITPPTGHLGFKICSICYAMVHVGFLVQHEDWHDWHQGTR